MQGEMSVLSLLMHATLVAKLVLVILVAASMVSWTMIFQRMRIIREARADFDKFEDRFWSGIDLNKLYMDLSSRREPPRGLETVFMSGFKEFARLSKQAGATADAILVGSARAMRVALTREVDKLETNLPFLATVGSISPYIGLFGTVWGIMNSFISLGAQKNASLATVAPGIAEALIATAVGLFAAIPAYIAYNRFSTHVEKIETEYDNFVEEFTGILQRKAVEGRRAGE
ncbi:MAG: protein TolQ [Gammaproteobacteria bacterium]|nr:protein TolQ [Gammaproteobacteria bacterium]